MSSESEAKAQEPAPSLLTRRQKLRRYWTQYGPAVLLGASTVLVATPSFFDFEPHTKWTIGSWPVSFNLAEVSIFGLAITLFVIGGVLTARFNGVQEHWRSKFYDAEDGRREAIADRDDQVSTIKEMVITISNMYASLLRQLAEECGVPEPYRFSLYDSADFENFKLYSRYASDPDKSGLTADELTKPKRKGCLGEAWSTGKSRRVFSDHRSTYKKQHRDLGYGEDEIEKFTMRPRAVFAMRFPQGVQDEYDGVLVIELGNYLECAEVDTIIGDVEKSSTWANIASAYKTLPTAIERSTSPAERGF